MDAFIRSLDVVRDVPTWMLISGALRVVLLPLWWIVSKLFYRSSDETDVSDILKESPSVSDTADPAEPSLSLPDHPAVAETDSEPENDEPAGDNERVTV